MNSHLQVLILAAGGSARLGQPKQSVRIAGETLLQRAVETALSANHRTDVSVVLGAHAAQLAPLLKHLPATLVLNRDWQEGIAGSIRCGVNACSGGVDAVLIMLADQYAVTAADLKRLIDAWRGQDVIVASLYQSETGVPAIFPRWCFSELLSLRGDQGAKQLIRRYSSRVVTVPMPSAALDLDTAEDLAKLIAQ